MINSPCKVWGWAGAEAELFFTEDTFSSIYLWMVFSINIIVTAATGKLFFLALNFFWNRNPSQLDVFSGFPRLRDLSCDPDTFDVTTLLYLFCKPLAAYFLSYGRDEDTEMGLSNRVESAVVYSTCIFIYLIFSKYSSSPYKVSLLFAACILSIPDHITFKFVFVSIVIRIVVSSIIQKSY